eukprot:COSAG02_NODE_17049_length_1032_cov_1.636656_1_plen_48_part_10
MAFTDKLSSVFIGIIASVALPLEPTLVRILGTMDFGELVLSTALHAHA